MNSSPQFKFPWGQWLILLVASVVFFWVGGCYEPTSGHVSVAATEVIGADDYTYYPGSEVYYSPAHRYYMYYDRGAWVHQPAPPRVWVRESPSVTIHLDNSPQYHHRDIVRQYPRNWRPPPRHDNDHHDHDRDHHDDHDRR